MTTTTRFPAIMWMALRLLEAIQCKGARKERAMKRLGPGRAWNTPGLIQNNGGYVRNDIIARYIGRSS
jgi:hypothetical protein